MLRFLCLVVLLFSLVLPARISALTTDELFNARADYGRPGGLRSTRDGPH
jgi:hypothetical protein